MGVDYGRGVIVIGWGFFGCWRMVVNVCGVDLGMLLGMGIV